MIDVWCIILLRGNVPKRWRKHAEVDQRYTTWGVICGQRNRLGFTISLKRNEQKISFPMCISSFIWRVSTVSTVHLLNVWCSDSLFNLYI